MSVSEITFTPEQVSAFSGFSRDRSPLHVDPEYARRTQFGKPVFFGIAGVMAALGIWAKGKPFSLETIRAQFQRPLFVGERYRLNIQETGQKVDLQIVKGTQLQSRIVFTWAPGKPGTASRSAFQTEFSPLHEAKRRGPASFSSQEDKFVYSPDLTAKEPFERAFGLKRDQWPAEQEAALLWSSYFVGMEAPGKQALFADLDFVFAQTETQTQEQFEIRELKLDYQPQYNRLTISGKGTGIQRFQINALCRPEPVEHHMESVRAIIEPSSKFAGKTIFISGAARGFGAVLARAFAVSGAKLALNHRSDTKHVRALENESKQAGTEVSLIKGDVTLGTDCEQMREEVFARFPKLDVLVCNAFPHIEGSAFLSQEPDGFLNFLQTSMAATSQLLYAFMPRLEPGATVVYISTIFTVNPEKQFSHYVAAKAAGEGLIRALATEFSRLNFVIFRPARMLTDQTNLPYHATPPASPIETAKTLLRALSETKSASNLREING
jgi:NAD(P)-dependent dehydrogenase (short-subunit alcohol dehydrogenase family)